jgi:hypothetical protein
MFKNLIKWLLKGIISIVIFTIYLFTLLYPFYNLFVPDYLSSDTIIVIGFIAAVFLYYLTIDSIINFLKQNWD